MKDFELRTAYRASKQATDFLAAEIVKQAPSWQYLVDIDMVPQATLKRYKDSKQSESPISLVDAKAEIDAYIKAKSDNSTEKFKANFGSFP